MPGRPCDTLFNGANLDDANFANADVWNADFEKVLNVGDSVQEALAEPFVARQR